MLILFSMLSAESAELKIVSKKSRISARLLAKVSGLDQTFFSERIENPICHVQTTIYTTKMTQEWSFFVMRGVTKQMLRANRKIC